MSNQACNRIERQTSALKLHYVGNCVFRSFLYRRRNTRARFHSTLHRVPKVSTRSYGMFCNIRIYKPSYSPAVGFTGCGSLVASSESSFRVSALAPLTFYCRGASRREFPNTRHHHARRYTFVRERRDEKRRRKKKETACSGREDGWGRSRTRSLLSSEEGISPPIRPRES